MKTHSTNYFNTLIEPSEDCKRLKSEVPKMKNDKKTQAVLQFDFLANAPYQLTSDDCLFEVFATQSDLTESEKTAARNQFFSKGQACFRCSPLVKNYGWAIHANAEGKIALIPRESDAYFALQADENIEKVKGMRNARK